MNTSRSTLSRLNLGLFSAVLVAVLLIMVIGLVAIDRALRISTREQATLDATATARVVEQVVDRDLDGLALLEPALTRDAAFAPRAGALAEAATGLTSIVLVDANGAFRHDTLLTGGSRDLATDSALSRTVIDAIRERRPLIRRAHGAPASSIILARPFFDGERVAGAAGASLRAQDLIAPLVHDAPRSRVHLTLAEGGDTILSYGTSGAWSAQRSEADVHLPGVVWHVGMLHAQSNRGLRIALWTLGLAAVVFLGVGVLRERRQAMRVVERSAELERLSSELLRANRMKSEFLANVSHELRTPLNAIVGFVDLLRDGVYGDLTPRQVPPVDRIAASATHLRHLVDQVLDIAKIAAGRLEVHSETIVLRPFVLNVASELESLLSERSLNLSIAVGATLPRVRTDPTHLRQILVNLIGNAVKYTSAGGVAVRARLMTPSPEATARTMPADDAALLARAPDRRRTWIALQVVDTGIGIAPADQERIFDEFEQVNAGPRGDSMNRGTGLGLAISRRLARLLGGDVSVESQPGRGSTFTVWLPVSTADLGAGAVAAPEPVGVRGDAFSVS